MSIIKFVFGPNQKDVVEVEAIPQLNILAHAQIAERSLQSKCGGQCACGTCRIRLVSGELSQIRPEEAALLKKAGAEAGMRLSCQSFPVDGADLVIEVPAERFKDARFTR